MDSPMDKIHLWGPACRTVADSTSVQRSAQRFPQPQDDVRVYLNPAEHPFCLFHPGA
ncbi:MAG: hypothetical protein ACRDSM_18315 [Pseudonocardiaceae bacterium]